MKKKIVFFGCVAFVIGSSCLISFSVSPEKNVSWDVFEFSDIEALTDCEIQNSKGKVIFSCTGENTCTETYFGKTLACDGTKN